MATSFFGGAFFGGEFFSEPTGAVAKTGTGGIDPGDVRRSRIVKPTGILHLPVKARPSVQERIEDSAGIAAEVAGRLAREFSEEGAALAARQAQPAVVEMSLAEVDAEIGRLLRKKMRTEEDEVLLLLLMAAAA